MKAALGQLWAHTPSIRLHLSSIPLREHIRRVLVVSKSPRQVGGVTWLPMDIPPT